MGPGATPLTVYDSSDSFGVGGTVTFGPSGVSGSVTGGTGTAAGSPAVTGTPAYQQTAFGALGLTPAMLILILAVVILLVR